MNMDYVKNLLVLLNGQKELKLKLNKMKETSDELAADLIDDFINEGVSSMNVDGQTLYIHNSMSASREGGIAAPDAAEMCKAVGLGDCVTIGTQKLTSYIRECEIPEGAAPGTTKEEIFFETYPQLKDIIHVEHKSSLRVRNA